MQPWRSGFPLAMQITLAGRLSGSMEAFKLKKKRDRLYPAHLRRHEKLYK